MRTDIHSSLYVTGDGIITQYNIVLPHRLHAYIQGNIDYARDYLTNNLPQIRIGRHEGTYLIWFDFRATGLTDEQIARKVLEEAKVIGDLGTWFGDAGKGFMRFNYACPRTYIEEQMKRLYAVFKN